MATITRLESQELIKPSVSHRSSIITIVAAVVLACVICALGVIISIQQNSITNLLKRLDHLEANLLTEKTGFDSQVSTYPWLAATDVRHVLLTYNAICGVYKPH